MNDDVFRYWSFARQKLGLSDAEFWRLTPRELRAMADGWQDDRTDEDRRAATVCMVIVNCHRDTERKPDAFTVEDFMPRRADEPAKEQSWESQVAIFGAIAEAARRSETPAPTSAP